MCGIVGIFELQGGSSEPLPSLAPALRVLAARGPDAEGEWRAAGCVFGHRRLSILDPGGGRQPWADAEQSPGVLTYNGELYNYRELRARLAGRGYRFRSECDTEVLHAAFALDGAQALEDFNGIFAFAWFDGRDRLWLVRDPLGVKPLYYSVVDGRVYFASTVAALLSFPQIPRVLDRAAAAHYLATARTNLHERTLLADIRLLPPGHLLGIRRGDRPESLCPRPYWKLPVLSPAEKLGLNLEEAQAGLRERLAAVVKRQLQSDVPVGAFLSGGLDSSILLALSKDIRGEALGCYGVEFSDAAPSEREGAFMREAARALKTRFHAVELQQKDFSSTWEHLLGCHGLPLSTPNEVAIYHLARNLKTRYSVALGGEGADEVFGGYLLPYASAWDYERTLDIGYSSVLRQRIRDFYGVSKFPHMADHHLALNVWAPPSTVAGLLGESLETCWAPVTEFYRSCLDDAADGSPLDRYLHLHRRVNLEGLLLRLDANTMAASVEGRVPFTDREIVEWANTLPDQLRLYRNDQTRVVPWRDHVAADWIQRGWVEGKRVLRGAFAERLPEVIVNRPKMSFPVPFQNELALRSERDRQWIAENDGLGAVVDRSAVLAFWDSTEMPGQYFRRWPLINLLKWADVWKVSR